MRQSTPRGLYTLKGKIAEEHRARCSCLKYKQEWCSDTRLYDKSVTEGGTVYEPDKQKAVFRFVDSCDVVLSGHTRNGN